ncbi:12729_t:CDS:1 [Ambispora gerdemannii]|uniref:12729_t:CDS:1 n=1 Tax=Ambispora gerdemannii TaxID=144530 RepID=A0A9N9G7Q4_9GLOM|nr:12729_t:CDS:1 [Ambispora gerdemannii]
MGLHRVRWHRESVKDIATTTNSRVEVIKQAKALKIQKLRCPSSISFYRYTSQSRKSISLGAGLYRVCWRRESVKDIATTTTSREEVIKQAKALKIQKLRCLSIKGLCSEVAEQSFDPY